VILIPTAIILIIFALIFAPTVVCSRKTDAAVATSAKKVEKEEEPEKEPEDDTESDDDPAAST